jgi:hypothetical protein
VKYCSGALCKKEVEDEKFSPGQFKDKYGQCRACQSLKRKRQKEKRAQEPIPENKQCASCREIKVADCFTNSQLISSGGKCKDCSSAYAKEYRIKNPEKKVQQSRTYYELNRDKVLAVQKIRYDSRSEEEKADDTEYSRQWYNQNKDRRNARYKERRRNDPFYRLRTIVSGSVRKALKRGNSSKNNSSILAHLPQPIEDIISHIEKLFAHPDNLTPTGEIWMNWNNWGNYNKNTWSDNDPSTWTWQLDHIIPQTDLPYVSMEDNNFKICWSLENLRPYSAKQNIIDGASGIRHKKQ